VTKRRRTLFTPALMALTLAPADALGASHFSRFATIYANGLEIDFVRPSSLSSGLTRGLELHAEALDDHAAEVFGFRSMRAVVDVDCRTLRDRVETLVAYRQAGFTGASQTRGSSGGWWRPNPKAYMAEVIRLVCGAPAPSLAATATSAGAQPSTILAPPFVLKHASPPHATFATSSSGPTQTQARLSARIVAQIGAAPTEEGAQKLLTSFERLLAPPLQAHAAAARVRGALVYRSVVDGFASTADAQSFCRRLIADGGACWIHALEAPLRPSMAGRPSHPPPRSLGAANPSMAAPQSITAAIVQCMCIAATESRP
jgi:hypothetical protein